MSSARRRPAAVRALLALLSACAAAFCHAFPVESRVPGGVALLPLDTAADRAPRAWLGEQAVWVARRQDQWVAIVGIALDAVPGRHELRLDDGRTVSFEVGVKHYPEQRITLKDGGRVTLSPENEARAMREIAQIQAIKRTWREEAASDGDLRLPAAGRLTGHFGLRRVFNGEPRAPHNGLDIAAPRGTPVLASAAGTVLAADDYFFNGRTVFVDHGNGLLTMVCHLDRIDVRPGQTVHRGQALGLSGMTGRASGPHVHWSVVLNGTMVDPALFLAPSERQDAVRAKGH